MREEKCHRFWLTNRNPITMKKCMDEKTLHINNRSKEQVVSTNKRRQNLIDRKEGFEFNNQ